jgi:hypothetical protein
MYPKDKDGGEARTDPLNPIIDTTSSAVENLGVMGTSIFLTLT